MKTIAALLLLFASPVFASGATSPRGDYYRCTVDKNAELGIATAFEVAANITSDGYSLQYKFTDQKDSYIAYGLRHEYITDREQIAAIVGHFREHAGVPDLEQVRSLEIFATQDFVSPEARLFILRDGDVRNLGAIASLDGAGSACK